MSLLKNVEPRDHQRKAVDKILSSDGNAILAHDVGTGKTLTSIMGFQALKDQGKAKKALVVVPASLRNNFAEDGVKKFTNDSYSILGNSQELHSKNKNIKNIDKMTPKNSSTYNIVSYDLFKRNPEKYLDNTKADTVIYDELHRAKNESSKITGIIKDIRNKHRNFIGLTGSIVSNSPADIVPLVDAMTDGKHSLGSKATFESRFLDVGYRGRKEVKNPAIVRALTSKYIDHVDKSEMNIAAPPEKILKVKKIIMSGPQADMYRHAINKLDMATIAKLKLGVGKLKDSELKAVANKLMAARQASNAPHTMDKKMSISDSFNNSNKAKELISDTVSHLKDHKKNQVIIGTQFIKGGVDVLSEGLKRNNIPFSTFIGKGNKGVTESSRQQSIKDYNSGKARAILISGAGGEGLNLPNTTMINMFDGHFNPEVINQMEARGIRSGGQEYRDPKDRKVFVNRYMSLPDKKTVETVTNVLEAVSPLTYIKRLLKDEKVVQNPFKRDFSTEEFISEVAQNKEKNNQEIRGLFKASALIKSDSSVMEDYYKEYGNKLEGVMGTGDRVADGEQQYIDKLKDIYRKVGTSKRYQNMNASKKKITYDDDDFTKGGKLKAWSYFSGKKNHNEALKMGATGAVIFPMLTSGVIAQEAVRSGGKGALAAAGVMSGLGAAISPVTTFMTKRNDDYGTMQKTKARKRLKLKDDELLRLLRGENLTKIVEKKEDYYIG